MHFTIEYLKITISPREWGSMDEEKKIAAKRELLLLPVRHSLWRRRTLFRGHFVNVNSPGHFSFMQSNQLTSSQTSQTKAKTCSNCFQ
jgi:hypothetical protein